MRYYERRGLIPEPPRRSSGYRQYAPDAVSRIQFIKRAQQLGFSLKEIADLLALRIDSETPCNEVRLRAEDKIRNIEAKIQTLQTMKQALVELVAICQANGTTGECPMLDALADNSRWE